MYPFVNICDKANFKELKGCDAIFLEKASTLPVITFLLNRSIPIPIKKKRGVAVLGFFISATDAIVLILLFPLWVHNKGLKTLLVRYTKE